MNQVKQFSIKLPRIGINFFVDKSYFLQYGITSSIVQLLNSMCVHVYLECQVGCYVIQDAVFINQDAVFL